MKAIDWMVLQEGIVNDQVFLNQNTVLFFLSLQGGQKHFE